MSAFGRKVKRKKNLHDSVGERENRMSYDDAEGLLLNLGVLAALVMSLVVGMNFMVGQDEIIAADFKGKLLLYKGFRQFAVDLLEQHVDQNGKTFNFTVFRGSWDPATDTQITGGININVVSGGGSNGRPPGLPHDDRYVDVKALLQEGDSEQGYVCHPFYVFDFPDAVKCYHFSIAGNIIMPYLQDEGLLSTHYATGHVNVFSARLPEYGAQAAVPLTLALLGSVFLYVSLVLLDVREDASGDTLALWCKVAIPTTLVLYAMLGLGITFFFYCLGDLLVIRIPASADAHRFHTIYARNRLIPGASILLLGTFIHGFWVYRHQGKREEETLPSDESDNIENVLGDEN